MAASRFTISCCRESRSAPRASDVGRHQVARAQLPHVAGHEPSHWQLRRPAVAFRELTRVD